jgi:deoxyribose-phosphate aldolase
MEPDRAQLAQLIDHTLLRPEATSAEVARLCAEAAMLGVGAVCVSPSMLPLPAHLTGSFEVCTVIGFPSGAHRLDAKRCEAEVAVADGADELDMVLDLGAVKSANWSAVESEIVAVVSVHGGALVKVIIESAALTDEEIVSCCRAAEAAGADFVKTSTGFHPAGGASEHAVALMRATVGDRLGVKASGGIRTTASALAMVSAGATRLGTSASAAILAGLSSPND